MQRWPDERMERIIGNLLRTGVFLSTLLVFAGAALYLFRHAADHPDFRLFLGEPRQLRGITGIAREAFALHGPGLIQLGLLVLIATPLARVAFSVFAFAAQRDRTYVVVTLIVLGILCFSLFGVHP
ncbi:MAG: DUF1634 domain-containing protein [Candidatus Krumholzibacteriia bacterium]